MNTKYKNRPYVEEVNGITEYFGEMGEFISMCPICNINQKIVNDVGAFYNDSLYHYHCSKCHTPLVSNVYAADLMMENSNEHKSQR